MTRISLSGNGDSPFEKLIGHNENILQNWVNLGISVFGDSSLDPELLEQVRRALAFGNKCEYCMVKGGKPNIKKKTNKEELATSFAELFAIDHLSINDGHFKLLKEEFTEKEISELCSFISFITACQMLGRIYNLTEEYQSNKVTTME
jgi:alkylhydroperoxidase family enzyme